MCHATSAGPKAKSVSTNKSQFVDKLSYLPCRNKDKVKNTSFLGEHPELLEIKQWILDRWRNSLDTGFFFTLRVKSFSLF